MGTAKVDERIEDLKHFRHKAEMLLACSMTLCEFWQRESRNDLGWLANRTAHQATRGGLLEAMCIHARSLLEFFGDRPRDERTLWRENFGYRPRKVELKRGVRGLWERYDTYVSHLSTGRRVASTWNFEADFQPVMALSADFTQRSSGSSGGCGCIGAGW